MTLKKLNNSKYFYYLINFIVNKRFLFVACIYYATMKHNVSFYILVGNNKPQNKIIIMLILKNS